MKDIILAVVRDFNGWLAVAIVGVFASVGIAKINSQWAEEARERNRQNANATHLKSENEHEACMYQLETERQVKTQVHRMTPENSASNVIEHRAGEGEE